MKTNTLKVFLIFCFCYFTSAQAQEIDSVAAMKDFNKVCNVYKKIPFHLSLNYKSSTNLVLEESDSLVTSAEFYITDRKSFIKFGHLEQFVDDSSALLVDNQNKRMVVYPNANHTIQYMRKLMMASPVDADITKSLKKYTISRQRASDTTTLILESRLRMPGTNIPKETITCLYDPAKMSPFLIRTIRKSILPVSQGEIGEFSSNDILKIAEQYYVVKTDVSEYQYKSIRHDLTFVPIVMHERIKKDREGHYTPMPDFSSYSISQN